LLERGFSVVLSVGKTRKSERKNGQADRYPRRQFLFHWTVFHTSTFFGFETRHGLFIPFLGPKAKPFYYPRFAVLTGEIPEP